VRALRHIKARLCTNGNACKMIGYDDFVELARLCLKEAHDAKRPNVASELKLLGKAFQLRAASVNRGLVPEIVLNPAEDDREVCTCS
jgi:hypothetical protein